MKIIYGTSNVQKIKQVEDFFKATNVDIEIVSPKEIGFDKEIIEDGLTFEENSMIKAKALQEFCKENNINEIIVTDDTGLCVECLNGEPGIYSGRYAGKDGKNATQEENIKKLLENMAKTGDKERKAKMVCVLTAVLPNGYIKQVRGECLGKIAEKPGPMGKLTYGPVFMPEGSNKVVNEFKDEELSTTHRQKAFMKLLDIIK